MNKNIHFKPMGVGPIEPHFILCLYVCMFVIFSFILDSHPSFILAIEGLHIYFVDDTREGMVRDD